MDSEARVDLNEGRNWLLDEFSGSSISDTAAKILQARAGRPDASDADKELIIDVNVSEDAAWSFVGAEVEPFFLGNSSPSPVLQPAACSGIKSIPSITVMVSFKGKMARASVRGESLEKGSTHSVVSSEAPFAANIHQAKEHEHKSTLTSLIAPSGHGVGPEAKNHTFLQQADSVDVWNCRKGFNLSLRSPNSLMNREVEDSLVFTAMKKAARLLSQNEETTNMVMIAGIDYPIDEKTRGTYYTGSSSGLHAETKYHLQPIEYSSSKTNLDSMAQEEQLSWCAKDAFIPYPGPVSTIPFASASLPPSQPVVCGVHSTSHTSESRKRPRELIIVNEDEFQRLKTLVTQMRYPPEEDADVSSAVNSMMNDSICGAQCPVPTMGTSLDSVIVSTSSSTSHRSKETLSTQSGEIILEPQGGTSSSFARALPRSHTFLRGLSSIDIDSQDDDGMNAEDDRERPFAPKRPPIQGFYDQTPVRFDFKMFRDLRLEDF